MISKSASILFLYYFIGRAQGYVFFHNSGPTVVGAKVSFGAIVREAPPPYNGEHLKYVFSSLDGRFYKEIFSTERSVNFTIEFKKDVYKAGNYVFEVVVKKRNDVGIYEIPFGIDRCTVVLTDLLNGHLIITQKEINKSDGVVFAHEPVNYHIMLSDRELDYLKDKDLTVFWYLDCLLFDVTPGFSTSSLYGRNGTYNLVAFVHIAATDVLNTTTTTTTTTTSTTTTESPRRYRNPTNSYEISLSHNGGNHEFVDQYENDSNFPCDVPREYVDGYYNKTIRVLERDPIPSLETAERSWVNSTRSSDGAVLNVTTSATEPSHFTSRISNTTTTSTTWNRKTSLYIPVPSLNKTISSSKTFLNGTIDVTSKSESGSSWRNSSLSLSNITSPLATMISNSLSKPIHLEFALNMIFHGNFSVEVPQVTEN